ncbi:SGNH/GDSL hydrolase family protein [Paraliomyxa miuraensis]|uniref:SGNH/GDSL hydrolase family protein n=1 Tax=Paraliomyxa miuraensis TaxID=376150 RepID=UPI00225BCD77|nr:DUF459 domain-containing protein [Paraliomyxa miuraensis]MCX4241634.1 DUF459 domain-containing protein [Paraliomyxa miuraensis]
MDREALDEELGNQEHGGGLGRRRWLTGLAGLAGATALMRPGVARADRYGPRGGTRVLVIGDSMIAGGFGLYLARALGEERGYDVTRRGKSSSGLARPDFFDWIAEAADLVEEGPFDATAVMFGGNDVQGLYMGKASGAAEWIRWEDEGWSEEYARRINALADAVAPDGQHLFWIGMPVMRPTKFHARVQRVNTIYRAEMAIRPNARFVDIWSVLADEDGQYADRIYLTPDDGETKRKKVTVRAGDGIHLTVAGAHHLTTHVEQVIHAELSGQG